MIASATRRLELAATLASLLGALGACTTDVGVGIPPDPSAPDPHEPRVALLGPETVIAGGGPLGDPLGIATDGNVWLVVRRGAGAFFVARRFDSNGALLGETETGPTGFAREIAVSASREGFMLVGAAGEGLAWALISAVTGRTLEAGTLGPLETWMPGAEANAPRVGFTAGGYVIVHQEVNGFGGASEPRVTFLARDGSLTRAGDTVLAAGEDVPLGQTALATSADGGVITWRTRAGIVRAVFVGPISRSATPAVGMPVTLFDEVMGISPSPGIAAAALAPTGPGDSRHGYVVAWLDVVSGVPRVRLRRLSQEAGIVADTLEEPDTGWAAPFTGGLPRLAATTLSDGTAGIIVVADHSNTIFARVGPTSVQALPFDPTGTPPCVFMHAASDGLRFRLVCAGPQLGQVIEVSSPGVRPRAAPWPGFYVEGTAEWAATGRPAVACTAETCVVAWPGIAGGWSRIDRATGTLLGPPVRTAIVSDNRALGAGDEHAFLADGSSAGGVDVIDPAARTWDSVAVPDGAPLAFAAVGGDEVLWVGQRGASLRSGRLDSRGADGSSYALAHMTGWICPDPAFAIVRAGPSVVAAWRAALPSFYGGCSDDGRHGVRVARLNLDGSWSGDPVEVSMEAGTRVGLASARDGRVLVTWDGTPREGLTAAVIDAADATLLGAAHELVHDPVVDATVIPFQAGYHLAWSDTSATLRTALLDELGAPMAGFGPTDDLVIASGLLRSGIASVALDRRRVLLIYGRHDGLVYRIVRYPREALR